MNLISATALLPHLCKFWECVGQTEGTADDLRRQVRKNSPPSQCALVTKQFLYEAVKMQISALKTAFFGLV